MCVIFYTHRILLLLLWNIVCCFSTATTNKSDSTSLISMSKPPHRGRVLVSSSRLEPLGSGGNQTQYQHQHGHNPQQPPGSKAISVRRGSGSKSADHNKKGFLVAAGTSVLTGMSKEKLQRRVSELECENQKLQSSLQKAEISIEGYRGFLSEKSAKRAYSVAIQTDFLTESNSVSKITPNKKTHIAKLTTKLDESTTKIQQLNQEIAELTQQLNEKDKDPNGYQHQYTTLKMNTELAEVSFKAQILTLEKDLRAANDRSQRTTDSQSFHSPTSNMIIRTPTQSGQKHHKTPHSLQGSVLTSSSKTPSSTSSGPVPVVASSHSLPSSSPTASTSSLKKLPKVPSTPPTSSDRLVMRPSPSAELLSILSPVPTMSINKLKVLSTSKTPQPTTTTANRSGISPSSLMQLKKKLNVHQSHCTATQQSIRQDFKEYNEFFAEGSLIILREIQKFEGVRHAALSKHVSTISSLRKDLAEAKHNTQAKDNTVAESTVALKSQFAVTTAALEREIVAAKEATERERDRADSLDLLFEAKMNEKEADISSLSTLFTSVSRELKNLQAKCKTEAAAVKHMGHCKDLVRVATIRELTLDKDRVFLELKYARYLI